MLVLNHRIILSSLCFTIVKWLEYMSYTKYEIWFTTLLDLIWLNLIWAVDACLKPSYHTYFFMYDTYFFMYYQRGVSELYGTWFNSASIRFDLICFQLGWVELSWVELSWVELSWVELSWWDLKMCVHNHRIILSFYMLPRYRDGDCTACFHLKISIYFLRRTCFALLCFALLCFALLCFALLCFDES